MQNPRISKPEGDSETARQENKDLGAIMIGEVNIRGCWTLEDV
jgi:hypothetical protein